MRKLFLMICLLLFSFQLKAETTVETGLLVNNTCAIDTVFFYSQKSGNQFKASYLFVKLDEDAAGNVIIRRGIKRYRSNLNTEIEFLETTDHVLKPGGVFKSEYVGMYCFYFSKTLASDELIYLAANTPGTEITSSSISYSALFDSMIVQGDSLLIEIDTLQTLVENIDTEVEAIEADTGEMVISLEATQALVDSLVQLASSPEPVIDNHTTLCENLSIGVTDYKCVSATNIDILGARSLYLFFDWSGGTVVEQFIVEPFFSVSATDTAVSQYGYTTADSLNIVEASYIGDKAIVEIDIKNAVAGGYFNCRLRTIGTGTITNIDVKLLEVY